LPEGAYWLQGQNVHFRTLWQPLIHEQECTATTC
jgi:hypothetical protein